MNNMAKKIGVYIDVANIYLNGGQKMQYDVLREFACRDEAEPLRLNAYVSYDPERGEHDESYRRGARNFHNALRDMGYKVLVKEMVWYKDEQGNRYGKANADLDLGIDVLLQSENLDRVLLVTGDGDFVRVVQALQNKGLRVEVLGLDNVSAKLKQEADFYISGYLIPNLIPMEANTTPNTPWGEKGSRARGWCYWHNDQGYGFIRMLSKIGSQLWLTDTRHPDSPFKTIFFHDSVLPDTIKSNQLPNRNIIFEFDLTNSDRGQGLQAVNLEVISRS